MLLTPTQTHHRVNEIHGRNLAEDLNSRVKLLSFAQAVVMILVAAGQVCVNVRLYVVSRFLCSMRVHEYAVCKSCRLCYASAGLLCLPPRGRFNARAAVMIVTGWWPQGRRRVCARAVLGVCVYLAWIVGGTWHHVPWCAERFVCGCVPGDSFQYACVWVSECAVGRCHCPAAPGQVCVWVWYYLFGAR